VGTLLKVGDVTFLLNTAEPDIGDVPMRSVCVPSGPGRQRKMPIINHHPSTRSCRRSRTKILLTTTRTVQHPDLRGHQPDPAHGHGPAAPEV